jgi:2-desacetyl-2-hydroxyethyl bacteriochlorophyllide A dehydrogenase
VFTGVGTVELRDVDIALPGPGEVQVETTHSTISAGTEGWILHNQFTWAPTAYPCVPGYERVGRIVALGTGVSGFAVGQRVVATISRWASPLAAQSGAHAKLGNTPVEEVYAVPEAVGDLDAAGAVIAQVGYNAAQRPLIAPGDWVLVYGDGMIGQCAAQSARARGGRVIIIGHRTERMNLAAAHSADIVLDNREPGVIAEVRRRLGSAPLRAILDTVQTEAAQMEYLPLLGRGEGGEIVYCGFTPGKSWADMGELQKKELTTHFVSGWSRPRNEETLAMMAAGKLKLSPLITHLIPADECASAYQMIAQRTAPFLGITLDWTKSPNRNRVPDIAGHVCPSDPDA